MNKKYEKMAKDLSEAGRFGDTRILHVNEAELAGLGSLLPSGKLPTNPETGQPEAGIITSMIIGAILGGTSGGITAKQKNIPLWQGILQGAGIGAATGALTGGLTAGLGEGASAGAQASVDAGTASLQGTTAQTLQKGIEQTAAESLSSGARQVGTDIAAETGKQIGGDVVAETAKQTAGDAAKDTLFTGVEEMVVRGIPHPLLHSILLCLRRRQTLRLEPLAVFLGLLVLQSLLLLRLSLLGLLTNLLVSSASKVLRTPLVAKP